MTAAPETIVAAAVRRGGITFSMPAPARHHSVLHAIDATVGGDFAVWAGHDQGFLTSTGRYVDRWDAAEIAVAARQIEAPRWPPCLYSEDLW